MTTAAQIKAALAKLDVTNDNHWTGDGLPRLETVQLLVSDQSLTREAVTQAAPGYSRATAYAAQQAAPAATPTDTAIAAPAAPAVAATPETGDNATDDANAGLPPTVIAEEGKAAVPAFDFTQGDELKAEKAKLDALRKAKEEATAAFNAQNKVVDELIAKQEASNQAKSSTPLAIQQYLASRRIELTKRGEQIARVRAFEAETGVKLADLAPKRAPIDAAMARKNARGTQRPKM
jgi:hypothetical protein